MYTCVMRVIVLDVIVVISWREYEDVKYCVALITF